MADTGSRIWVFVDDYPREAEAYRDSLGGGELPMEVMVLAPNEARKALLTGQTAASGILMDVDLSGEAGVYGTGLGLAQDLRAAQKSGKVAEFPIIRFANREPVQRNVGGDPASDDLFDDKIEKTEVGQDLSAVQRRMRAVEAIYVGLKKVGERDVAAQLIAFLGLDAQSADDWLHPAFLSRLIDGHAQAVHVAAGTLSRTCLAAAGLMVHKSLLLLRLGLSQDLTGEHWALVEEFSRPFKYSGVGSEYAELWWSRGLEEAWYLLEGAEEALAMTDIYDRVGLLSKLFGTELPAYKPDRTSPGARPWRWCTLSQEKSPSVLIGVDPWFSVRMTPRGEAPPWVDPPSAAYGQAIRVNDPRLNSSDLERLKGLVG